MNQATQICLPKPEVESCMEELSLSIARLSDAVSNLDGRLANVLRERDPEGGASCGSPLPATNYGQRLTGIIGQVERLEHEVLNVLSRLEI